jgi:hypothetical protein
MSADNQGRKRSLFDVASEDANALFHGEGSFASTTDERKALSLYRWEYSNIKRTASKAVAKEVILASASSAAEAVALLANSKKFVEDAPQIGNCSFFFFFFFFFL